MGDIDIDIFIRIFTALQNENIRQETLVHALGQATCGDGNHDTLLPCPECGAAL